MAQNGKFPSSLWAPVVPKFKILRILNRTTLSFIFTFLYKDLWKQTNFTPLTMDHINNMLKLQLSHYLNCDGGKIYESKHHRLDGLSLSELRELVMDREAWCAAIHGLQRVGHDWATELNWSNVYVLFPAIWSDSIFLQLLNRYDFGK